MHLLNAFAKHVGPGGLSGSSFGQWLKVLRENHYSIDMRYWPRALLTTLVSIENSFWHWREKRFNAEVERTEVPAPLFVLGIWRSGTTHLHNLLAQDARFSAPNLFQVMNPHSFLTTESLKAAAQGMFVAKTRPMDNVRLSISDDPQEDEFALSPDGHSFMNTCAFPRSGDRYRRLLTFKGATQEDIELWKSKLMWFYKKLTLKYQKPLVLKSPTHTGKVETLLQMFPTAKFVHIHRHPYSVVQSTKLMMEKAFAFWCFQKPNISMERIIGDYEEVINAFFAQRNLIPEENFSELAYEDLIARPMPSIQRVYEELGLPDFTDMRPLLESYLASIADYQRNQLVPPPMEVKRELATRVPNVFDEWGYER